MVSLQKCMKLSNKNYRTQYTYITEDLQMRVIVNSGIQRPLWSNWGFDNTVRDCWYMIDTNLPCLFRIAKGSWLFLRWRLSNDCREQPRHNSGWLCCSDFTSNSPHLQSLKTVCFWCGQWCCVFKPQKHSDVPLTQGGQHLPLFLLFCLFALYFVLLLY